MMQSLPLPRAARPYSASGFLSLYKAVPRKGASPQEHTLEDAPRPTRGLAPALAVLALYDLKTGGVLPANESTPAGDASPAVATSDLGPLGMIGTFEASTRPHPRRPFTKGLLRQTNLSGEPKAINFWGARYA